MVAKGVHRINTGHRVRRRFRFARTPVHNENKLSVTNDTALTALVRQAKKRLYAQLVLDQLTWGAVAGLACLVLLLITGTQVLRWYWPALLVVLSAAVGWWRSRHRFPDDYQSALRVDRSLGANDLLSTAWYFENGGTARTAKTEFLTPVQQQAESLASHSVSASVIPWRRPAALWPVLGLMAVACGVFGIRYGVLQSMDLRGPIAEVRFDTLTGAPLPPAGKPGAGKKPGLPQPEGIAIPDGERADLAGEDPFRQEDLKNFQVASNEMGKAGKGENGRRADSPAAGDEESVSSEEGSGDDAADSDSAAGSKDPARKEGKQAQDKQPPAPKDGGLMDKMRDALANLMDKLKMDQKGGDSQQMASNKKGGSKGGEGKKQNDGGMPSKGKQEAGEDPGDQAQGDQPGDGQQSQMAKAGNQNNDAPSKNEKSGVGSQDGRKDTELAEHAEAMGKLSEILGKRSQNLQGEVMVEVTNSKNQQVRTAFTGKKAAHTDAGGEINRDEVPLHLQHYVQSYYEQIRKQPAPPLAAPTQKQ